ncbi:antitoxin VapB family protein [Candidatus Woesearchaeota archaeon]|nr:antitoxin VapB family protein [Candidatus Woesearchaeota archaeon]
MATKTISIAKSAYDRLKVLKKERESFTDVINRITGKKNLMDFYGVLNRSTADKIEEAIKESRKQNRKLEEARMKRLMEEWKE